MSVQAALIAAQMWLGEITRPRPHKTTFDEFNKSNQPSESRPIVYAGGTVELIPSRIWYGDFSQRAVERDSHWTDYLWAGPFAFLLDTITVAYRYYCGEVFALCWGPDAHVEYVKIDERPVFRQDGVVNAGGGFLIDDPQAWGGDQPPGQGGEYAWCDVTRGNYTDGANAYLESILTTPPNKTPSLRGVSCLVVRGRSGFTESGYFAAGGVGFTPKFREWKVTIRRQPDNLATGLNALGRHMNAAETLWEWCVNAEYGAAAPVEELNVASFQQIASDLYDEYLQGASAGCWSGKVETATHPIDVVTNVLEQIDGILDPSPSLGLTLRLVRRDYSFSSLRTLDADNITHVERFTPGTYEDTINKRIVPFKDIENNSADRTALYVDVANQQIQGGRLVPESKEYLGVADSPTGNLVATRDGRALAVPRAPLTCSVLPSFGKLTYRGEVLKFNWSQPTMQRIMRVLAITPGNAHSPDYALEMIEDQFALGFRTFGEPDGTGFNDPGAGLDTAPPDAAWDTSVATCGLLQTTVTTNTNQFQSVIEGHVVFGTYAPGGQYGRIWATEPGGVQTLSPLYLAPDDDGKAMFTWPALAVGTYEFCVQTYSLRGATNGDKVCCTIAIAQLGSPSVSPSHSASPSLSPSISPSGSQSPSSSFSPSVSFSASVSPSGSASPSGSVSPSHSQSPSASASPSTPGGPGDISGMQLWLMADAGTYTDLGSTPAGNNDLVRQWSDQSGSSNNAIQDTSGQRATLITGALNGLPIVRFVNGKKYSLPTTLGASGRGIGTFFYVGRFQNQDAFDGGNQLTGHSSGSAELSYIIPGQGSGTGHLFELCGVTGTSVVSQNTYFQSNATADGAIPNHIEHRLNQAANGNGDAGGSNANGFNQIAAVGGNAGHVRGDIAEFIYYDRVLTSMEIGVVETYLNGKWGV